MLRKSELCMGSMWVLFAVLGVGSAAVAEIGADWQQVTADAPFGPRTQHTAEYFLNKIWVFGGSSQDSDTSILSDIWSSSDGVNWTQEVIDAAYGPRRDHTTVIFNGNLYLIGGVAGVGIVKKDVWTSSDGTTWTPVTTDAGFGERFAHASVVYDNKIWVLGGVVNGTSDNDVWSSPDGITWTPVTASAPWTERHVLNAFVLNDKMWIMNGRLTGVGSFNDIWSSTDGINWTNDLPSAPWSPAGDTTVPIFNGLVYNIGGSNSEVWRSSDGINWTEISDKSWPNRGAHASVATNDSLYIFAGGSVFDDIWVSRDSCLAPDPAIHSADQDANNIIGLTELLRAIQLFNLFEFHCDCLTEDFFAPGVGDQTCTPHSGDYNTQNWSISLSELLRLIQFFNIGGYSYCPGTGEDSFCPGL